MGNTVAQARDKAKDGQTYSSKRAKKVYKKGDEETTVGDKDKSKKSLIDVDLKKSNKWTLLGGRMVGLPGLEPGTSAL